MWMEMSEELSRRSLVSSGQLNILRYALFLFIIPVFVPVISVAVVEYLGRIWDERSKKGERDPLMYSSSIAITNVNTEREMKFH